MSCLQPQTPPAPGIAERLRFWKYSRALVQGKAYHGRRILAESIDEAAFVLQLSATECGQYDYSRSGNPTRTQLEAQIADLEAATRSFAFVSGMAALSAVLRTISCGDHIVAGDDLYGGTSRLLAQVAPNLGLEVTHVDTTDVK